MTSVLFMGAPYEVQAIESRSLVDCFNATGQNTGNLLIGNGLYRQLDYQTIAPFRGTMTPGFVNETFDQVVIAAANFLYPKFDFGYLSAFLEQVKLPVFMVGLGAQLPAASSELKDVPAGTWRLVEIAAERSRSIGVRGEFTADQLSRHGIKNARVMGCPSLYTNMLQPPRLRLPERVDPSRVVVNGSRNVVAHSSNPEAARRVEVQLVQWAMQHGVPYVLQNEQPEMQVAVGEDRANHEPQLLSLSKFFQRDQEALADYYAAMGKTFFSIEDWFAWIQDYQFSIGTRFHGNVAALLNGVPAVIVTHDSRTRELCDFAAIPSIDITDIDSIDPPTLYMEADFEAYTTRLQSNTEAYMAFLDENDIRHKFSTSVAPGASAVGA